MLPRALVIMDEFQVLFSEEDRLAREAGRLLADIAKRGAAFGLHLLLATQSPGGPLAAYLRPVYEQMALRIALGCTAAERVPGDPRRGQRRRHQAGPGRATRSTTTAAARAPTRSCGSPCCPPGSGWS